MLVADQLHSSFRHLALSVRAPSSSLRRSTSLGPLSSQKTSLKRQPAAIAQTIHLMARAWITTRRRSALRAPDATWRELGLDLWSPATEFARWDTLRTGLRRPRERSSMPKRSRSAMDDVAAVRATFAAAVVRASVYAGLAFPEYPVWAAAYSAQPTERRVAGRSSDRVEHHADAWWFDRTEFRVGMPF